MENDEHIAEVEGVEERDIPAATPEDNARALAVQPKAALAVGEYGYIVPTNVEEAARMASAVVVAGLAPDSYKNDKNKILLGIMAAMEAGLPPLYGLRQIAIINGRPTIWGDTAMALIQSKNLIDEYTEEQVGPTPTTDDLTKWPDDYGWKVTIRRRGQKGAYVGVFTVGMAKRAKLWNNMRKTPWIEHPDRMLKIRARAFPQRDGFADALAGLAIREEIEDTFGPEDNHPEINLSNEALVEPPPMETEEETTDA